LDGAVPGILHVCTANRCRSAIAERLTRAALPDELPVTSAGTRARVGEPIWPEAAEELERRRVSSLGFASHPLEEPLVRGADLVLTATRAHRDEVVASHPAALRRTFTWRELAWLVTGLQYEEVPGRTALERLAALASIATGRRGLLQAPAPHLFDIADPVAGPRGAVAAAAAEVEQALAPLVTLLR
jgi:protein-tyrosine phosphatase